VIDGYHPELAATALIAGLAVAACDRWVPSLAPRAVALAGLAGALLGSWGSPRGWPWIAAATVVLVVRDDPERTHPLGVATLPLAVVALAGVWAAVPDTEPPLAAAAALVPIAVLRSIRRVAVGPSATAALVVAVVGAVWVGSAGWGAALASMGAVGLIAVAPLVSGMGTRTRQLPRGRLLVELVAAQAVVSLAVPRLVMSRPVPVAVAVAAVVTLLLGAWCARRMPQPVES
jgi:hypothetical protein